jgi:diguanylate cyclase (GGDEF)-like protein/PAS domain S-box-containing protein/hemerythrin-like metal-binding protein
VTSKQHNGCDALTLKLADELQQVRAQCARLQGIAGDAMFASAFEHAAIGMALVAPDGHWIKVNNALCQIVGYTDAELVGKTFQDITHPDDLEEDLGQIQRMLSGEIQTYQKYKRYFHKNGNIIHVLLSASLVCDTDNVPLFFIAQIQDVTKQKEYEAELVRLAREDALTGVCSRRCFLELATREIIRGGRFREPSVVLMIDIDNFKIINDTYGHACGDVVLKKMANTCKNTLRSLDVFGRLGGEEFGALLINTDAEVGRIIAERLRLNIEKLHVQTDAGEIHFTVSIGLVAFIGDFGTIEFRLRQADEALYKAKAAGRNRVEAAPNVEELDDTFECIQSGLVHVTWDTSYECGNATIDAQHRRLFEISNVLLSAVIGGKSKMVCKQMIEDLLSATIQHFRSEYEIIRSAGYPSADDHSKIHNDLVTSMHLLARQFDSGELEVGKLINFLAVDVISKHMLQEDKKFFPYLSGATS